MVAVGLAANAGRYTERVDRVRLGRALGYGTRHAAKTLAAVAEAAAAPGRGAAAGPGKDRGASIEVRDAGGPQGRPVRRMPTAAQVRGAGRSMWGPLATFSSALSLRVAGLFFGLIALAMARGAWRLREGVRTGGEVAHFWLFAGFAALFGYFAVSSFVRANLRERRAAEAR